MQIKAIRRSWVWGGLGSSLLLASLLALSVGAVPIPPLDILLALLQGPDQALSSMHETIIEQIRLPRWLMGMSVGAGLAVAGAVMQGVFRNPLADPALIGVSAGAALGAVSMIVFGGSLLSLSQARIDFIAIPLGAFAGGMIVTATVYRLATRDGHTEVMTLLLAGIAFNALAFAFIGLLSYFADDNQLRTLTFWQLGALGSARWDNAGLVFVVSLLVIFTVLRYGRALNAMLLGESEAYHMGFDVQQLKWILLLAVTTMVAIGVAFTGVIGFIGLVTPHLVRLALGPDHRALIPAAAILGACLILLADLLARTLVVPAELPIGTLTAILGAPFFLLLILRQRRQAVSL